LAAGAAGIAMGAPYRVAFSKRVEVEKPFSGFTSVL